MEKEEEEVKEEELEDDKSNDDDADKTKDPDEEESTDDDSEDDEEEDDDLIALPSGDKVTLEELRNGYMKDSDYRQKTRDLARLRETYKPPTQEEPKKETD